MTANTYTTKWTHKTRELRSTTETWKGRQKVQEGRARQTHRIGDRVRSNRFGRGVVQGINPNGTLIVRFAGRQKSREVFPTLLEEVG